MSEGGLQDAKAALERALAARPQGDGAALTEATKAVAAYRDTLRLRLRGAEPDPDSRGRLKRANGVITLLLAGHYPLGPTPWSLLEQAKTELEQLAGQ